MQQTVYMFAKYAALVFQVVKRVFVAKCRDIRRVTIGRLSCLKLVLSSLCDFLITTTSALLAEQLTISAGVRTRSFFELLFVSYAAS